MTERFSDRRGLTAFDRPIEIREGAPEQVRQAVVHFAADTGLAPRLIRATVLDLLALPPGPKMWHGDDYVLREASQHLAEAEWFEVYDAAETLYQRLELTNPGSAHRYAERLNKLFMRLGVGWKLERGLVKSRGSESFELQIGRARVVLEGMPTARQEVHEALLDLSRRPSPDLTGAVQHAAAALECVSREVTGQPNLTFGEIIKRCGELFPPPVGSALEKLWGFSSERARHLREGGAADREEAEFVVSVVAAAVTYLVQKQRRSDA